MYMRACVRMSALVGVCTWTRNCERIVPPSLALRSALLASSACAAAAGPCVLPTGGTGAFYGRKVIFTDRPRLCYYLCTYLLTQQSLLVRFFLAIPLKRLDFNDETNQNQTCGFPPLFFLFISPLSPPKEHIRAFCGLQQMRSFSD